MMWKPLRRDTDLVDWLKEEKRIIINVGKENLKAVKKAIYGQIHRWKFPIDRGRSQADPQKKEACQFGKGGFRNNKMEKANLRVSFLFFLENLLSKGLASVVSIAFHSFFQEELPLCYSLAIFVWNSL